jgi:hypothetical protein
MNTLRTLSVDDYANMLLSLSINDLIRLCQIAPTLKPLAEDRQFWAVQAQKNFDFPVEIFLKSCETNSINLYIEIAQACDKELSSYRFERSLTEAIERGDLEVIRYWLSVEKRRDDVKWKFTELLRVAARVGHMAMLKLLLEFGKTHYQSYLKDSIKEAIQSASYHGHGAVVQYLNDQIGGHYDQKTLDEALVKAAQSDNLDLVKYWIEKGATSFNEALKEAALSEKVDVVRHLIGLKTADLNTVLMELARYTWVQLEMIQEIVKAGATNLADATALVLQRNRFDTADYLIDAGARPNPMPYSRDDSYTNPEEKPVIAMGLRAFEVSHFDIIKFVGQSGAKNLGDVLIKAASANRVDVVVFLIANGALSERNRFERLDLINPALAAAHGVGLVNGRMMTTLLQVITGQTEFTDQEVSDYCTLAEYMVKIKERSLSYTLKQAARDSRKDIIDLIIRTPLSSDTFNYTASHLERSKHTEIARHLRQVAHGKVNREPRLPYLAV